MASYFNLVMVALSAVVVRWCVSLNGYSGAEKSPMYGDYEAQRHWMEITYNLPVKNWYTNMTDNDLMYWGLDYPPLTAYHSWVMGKISHLINADWIALRKSRGYESTSHKLFMRYTVLVADILIFFPALCFYFYKANAHLGKKQLAFILTILLYPGLIIIDHGHFQYNCVSLGLFVWAVSLLSIKQDVIGSVAFSLALNYKQMELYHAVPFFFYLLGKCFKCKMKEGIVKLLKLGLAVIITFGLCWLPFLFDKNTALQVLQRLFPFQRGLFEDKVSNVWCSLNVVIKFQQLLPVTSLIKLCLVATLVGLLPSSVDLFWNPSLRKFKFALVNSSMVFFLFSFQVHEKSILIPAISVCLLLPEEPLACLWFLFISSFSLLPLLIKDGVVIAFFTLMVLFTAIAYEAFPAHQKKTSTNANLIITLLSLSIIGACGLSIASLMVTPPQNLPDFFPVLISIYSCIHFVLFTLFFFYRQLNLKIIKLN